MSNYFELPSEGELVLAHHGILGQRWGIRRYQNPDGSLTAKGRARYGTEENLRKVQSARAEAEAYRIRSKAESKQAKADAKLANKIAKREDKRLDKISKEDLKREKKYLKEQNKYRIKQEKKYDKKTKNFDYNRPRNNEFLDKVIKPIALNAGNKVLDKYVNSKLDDFLMSDDEKNIKKWLKDTEKNNTHSEYLKSVRRNDFEQMMKTDYIRNTPLNTLKNDRQRYNYADLNAKMPKDDKNKNNNNNNNNNNNYNNYNNHKNYKNYNRR